MIVTSLPSRFTSASPSGMSSSTSSSARPFPSSCREAPTSSTSTGLLSRIAVFNNPFASRGVAGVQIFKPGNVRVKTFGRVGMRRAELMRRAVRTAERDRDIELPARHREHVRRVVHDLVERDEAKN